MPLRVTVDGESWLSEDYTLGEQVAVEQRTKVRWGAVVANADADREFLRALIVVWLAKADGVSTEDAEKRADALTGRQFAAEQAADDRPIEHADGIPVVDPKAVGDVPATT